jgi:Zn-dependent protease with chaperone function
MSVRDVTHLASSLARREQSHRRAALLGIAALLVLSTSPVFGHHLTDSASALLAGRDHLWSICLVAVHMLLAPVHGLFHIMLFVGLSYAVWDRVRAWRRVRETLGTLEWAHPQRGDPFFVAANAAGLSPGDVRIIEGLPTPAFTAGWVRPKVFVAGNLSARLSAPELAAVFAHEAAHIERRDPLRLSLLRFLGCVLFWLPALRRLAADLADEAEIEADDHAARHHPLVLASALVTLAGGEPVLVSGIAAPGFRGSGSSDLLERRVRRLAGADTSVGTHVTRRSLGGAVASLALVWLSGVVVAHPLPTASAAHAFADHCEHHSKSALTHLFCLHSANGSDKKLCPHTHG